MQVGRSMTVQNLLFRAHTLCMSYVTNTFLLVRSTERSKQLLCFVHGQGQKSKQYLTTKKFVEFHNHSHLLIMAIPGKLSSFSQQFIAKKMTVKLTNIFPGLRTAICRSAVRVGMLIDSSDSLLFTFCSITDFLGHVMTE